MRKGKLIAFIGMDGAGKSTLTNKLEILLKKKNLKVQTIYCGRGRNNILPIVSLGKIYRNMGGQPSNAPKYKNKYKNFEKISLIQTISAPIFAFDLFLRYYFNILPKLKKYDIIIADRYSTDILLMNKVPFWLKKILFKILPKANKIFYIFNDIKILHKRKPSHNKIDLIRQERIFKKILKEIKVKRIKNDNLDKSLKQIIKWI